jgi:TPR repeat protein
MKPLALVALIVFAAGAAFAGTEDGLAAFKEGDYATALKELAAPAEQGDGNAMLLLGKLYSAGLGVTRDTGKATKFFARSAEAGNIPGQYEYGSALTMGEGVEQDMVEALKWLILSARGGHKAAQIYIKRMAKLMPRTILGQARRAALEWKSRNPTAKNPSN